MVNINNSFWSVNVEDLLAAHVFKLGVVRLVLGSLQYVVLSCDGTIVGVIFQLPFIIDVVHDLILFKRQELYELMLEASGAHSCLLCNCCFEQW